MKPEDHIDAHRKRGRFFEAACVQSFVLDQGGGEPVVCMHGVPASSFLYRKVVPALAERGLRGIAFDYPGMGLAGRPEDFDYTFTGLGQWSRAAVDALGLDTFHLAVHDIGGPIGLELAASAPDRVLSLTILNSIIVGIDGFKKPWVMRPFGWPVLNRMYLATLNQFMVVRLMYWMGVNDKARCPPAEAAAYAELLRRKDGGRAFLKIMEGFETTPEKEKLYVETIQALRGPAQIIWGEDDRALPVGRFGAPIQHATGIPALHRLPSKHFLQEDQAPAIAMRIAEQAAPKAAQGG